MNKLILAAAVVAAGFSGSSVFAEGKSIGVSWASFQEERWKIDEAAMVAAIEAEGNSKILSCQKWPCFVVSSYLNRTFGAKSSQLDFAVD